MNGDYCKSKGYTTVGWDMKEMYFCWWLNNIIIAV